MFGLGSTSQLGIGIAISLQNKFSGQATQVNNQLLQMKRNAQSLADSAIKNYRDYSARVSAGAAAATYGLYRLAESQSEFQHKINQVYITGGKELGRTRAQLEDFAKSYSLKFAKTPTEIAAALFENAKAGVKGNIEEITKYQMAVAKSTDERLEGEEGVANTLLRTAHAFSINTNNAKEFARVANSMTATANASMSSIRSLGEAMKYGAFTARTFNIPLEDTEALMAKLSQSGIEGTSSGTALQNMISYLGMSTGSQASNKQKDQWKILGLDRKQMQALMDKGKVFEVLSAIDKQMIGMGPTEKYGILKGLMNIRGTRGALATWGNATPGQSLEDFRQAALRGVGSDIAMKQSKAMQNDLFTDIQFLKNSFHVLGIEFIKAATPILRVVLPIVTKVVTALGHIADSPIGNLFAGLVAVGAPLIALLFGFRAAALTATIALRGFSNTVQLGGFKGLFGASMNMLGTSLWQRGIQDLPEGIKLMGSGNNLRAMMGKGAAPINYGGKTYTRGFVPLAALGLNAATIAQGVNIGNAVTGQAGLLGRMTGILGGVFGGVMKLVPIVGGIFTLVSIADALFGFLKSDSDKEKAEKDPAFKSILDNYYNSLGVDKFTSESVKKAYMDRNKQPISITLNTNVDGRTVDSKQLDFTLEDMINKQFDVNLQGY